MTLGCCWRCGKDVPMIDEAGRMALTTVSRVRQTVVNAEAIFCAECEYRR